MFPGRSESVPNKMSSFHRPHYLPKLDPEGGHPTSPNMIEKVSKEKHDELVKKVELIKKTITDWKEILAATKELVIGKGEIES